MVWNVGKCRVTSTIGEQKSFPTLCPQLQDLYTWVVLNRNASQLVVTNVSTICADVIITVIVTNSHLVAVYVFCVFFTDAILSSPFSWLSAWLDRTPISSLIHVSIVIINICVYTDKRLLFYSSKLCFNCVCVFLKPVEKEAVTRCVYWDFEK